MKIFFLNLIFIILSTKFLFAEQLVRQAQSYLLISGFDVGNVDGIKGPKTIKALKKAYSLEEINNNYKIKKSDIKELRYLYFKRKLEQWSQQPHLNKKMSISDARHLLERTGIGANYLEILRFSNFSRAEGIFHILKNFNTFPQSKPPNFIYEELPEYWIRWDYDEPGRQSFRVARDNEIYQLKNWWIKEMISTPYPQNERLLLFWTNHFPVEYSSISEESISIAKQHLMFRENGFGNFKVLVKQIIRDPAMLNYLDAESSKKGAPNENLGRELMELFVLGEGNYTEKTVKEASRALTGYRYNRLRNFEVNFSRAHWAHDKKQKSLFGKKGNFDGDDLIDILFLQPEAATFLTKKFWKYYISETFKDEKEVEKIAERFKESDFEIPVLFSEIISSESFWDIKYRGTIIKSPVDLVIGTIRSTGFLPLDWQRIPGVLANLGQNIFEPPNVGGWSRGASWITPARLLNRSKFLANFFDNDGTSLIDLDREDPEITMSRNDNIIIRYGAENFEGPPKFKIMLLNNQKNPYKNELKWKSPMISAKNGHDTELFGRVSREEIPWTMQTFDIDPSIEFNKVSVHFVNDHCCGPGGSDGGDRNFFLDWIKIGKNLFLAKDGRQNSNCTNNNNNPGFLYCSGNVTMDITQSIKVENSTKINEVQNKKDQLIIERVAFDWGEKYNKNDNWNEINISLLNIKFNSHFQSGIKLKIVHDPNRDFKIVLTSENCSDTCISGVWPKSNFTWEDGRVKVLEFSIGPKEKSSQKKQYNELNKNDQKFISALWRAIPSLIEKMQEGRNFKERNGKDILHSWEKVIKKMYKRLEKSKYVENNNFPKVLFVSNKKKSEGMMSMAMSSFNQDIPIPASVKLNKDLNEWEKSLNNSIGYINIKKAVLANNPVSLLNNQLSLKNLITNPVFHLK